MALEQLHPRVSRDSISAGVSLPCWPEVPPPPATGLSARRRRAELHWDSGDQVLANLIALYLSCLVIRASPAPGAAVRPLRRPRMAGPLATGFRFRLGPWSARADVERWFDAHCFSACRARKVLTPSRRCRPKPPWGRRAQCRRALWSRDDRSLAWGRIWPERPRVDLPSKARR